MRDQIDKLLTSYSDVYATQDSNRLLELESKFGDSEFDGIHIGAPDQVEPAIRWIPTVTLSSTKMNRRADVNERQNSVIIAINLDQLEIRTPPLYKPPTKRLKPMRGPKPPKPADLSTTARSYSARFRVIGEDGDLMPGTYSVSIIEWDRVSNIRTVVKLPKPSELPIKLPAPQWPWEQWKLQAADFRAQPGSPKLDGDVGLAVAMTGADEKAALLGSFGTKARPIHLIAADPGAAARSDIRAGVPVDLLQFTLDTIQPEQIRILAPIQAAAPVKSGDALKGWFTYPVAKLQRKEETMVYVFVDGMRSGPFKIPALKP